MQGTVLASQLFPAAAQQWLDERRKISEKTRGFYSDYILTLSGFFGGMRLDEIHVGHVATYQKQRQGVIRLSPRHRAGKRSPEKQESDGASRINHEISCLGQILHRAGLWTEIKKFYEPLPLPRESVGMALSDEEKEHLFEVGMRKTRWHLAAYCSLLSRNTSAGTGEIRHLRLGEIDVDGDVPSIYVSERGAKNEFRQRRIPLNSDAERAVRWLLARAHRLGCREAHHYLLPHQPRQLGAEPDPLKPMGSWKKAHRQICKEAGKRYPNILRFRPNDDRHTAATDMLENPNISFTTIEHMMGHRINSKTKRKYDHLRNESLRFAAEALNRNIFSEKKLPQRILSPIAQAAASSD